MTFSQVKIEIRYICLLELYKNIISTMNMLCFVYAIFYIRIYNIACNYILLKDQNYYI